MPSITAVNVARVVMEYTNGTLEKMQNSYYVKNVAAWSVADLEALVEAFSVWEETRASLERTSDVRLIRVTATDLTSLTSNRVDDILAAPVIGQRTSPTLPANATFALKANIGERGKGRNGRTFWVGLAEDQVTNQSINTVNADNMVTAMNDLITDIDTALPGAQLGIIHTTHNGVPIEPAEFSETQSYNYTDLTVDSQRDRLPGHKKHKRPVAP